MNTKVQQLRDVYGDSVDKIIQGNAMTLDSLVATPTGWVRNGDIKVGDEVLTPYGTVTTVTGVYPKGVRPVYEVKLRDGSKAEICNEHLWQIERSKTAIKFTGNRDDKGKREYIGTGPNGQTHEIISEVIDTDELRLRVDKGRQISLPRIEPLAYYEQDLPLDPYVLGVILGDGSISKNGGVKITNSDMFVIVKLIACGCDITKYTESENRGMSWGLSGLAPTMRDLDLNGKRAAEKFIPEQYLYGSVEQRLALLQGLMDTDGYISESNEIEYSSASEQLAKDIQALIRSLGGRVDINVKEDVFYTSPTQIEPKRARKAYRLQNVRLQKINPFSLPRKADRWSERNDNSGNRVVSVTYLRDEVVQCISVADERHLYITDDYMPTHNTENIVFLKSTDDGMIDTLVKMSGTTHEARVDQKTITRDNERLLSKNEGKISYTMATKERPVIQFNDFMFIKERNSIVIKAGGSPLWNRNETAYPMSYRLFKDTISLPGKKYSLQTIPTNSSAKDFDVRKNQPDFFNMLDQRLEQARMSDEMKKAYLMAYGLSETDLIRLDQNVVADDIMHAINSRMFNITHRQADVSEEEELYQMDDLGQPIPSVLDVAEENVEVTREAAIAEAVLSEHKTKRYAGGLISRDDLVSTAGQVNRQLDKVLAVAYAESHQYFEDTQDYRTKSNGELVSSDGELYVRNSKGADREDVRTLDDAIDDPESRVYSEDASTGEVYYEVTDAFIKHLADLNSWQDIAQGRFERDVIKAYHSKYD